MGRAEKDGMRLDYFDVVSIPIKKNIFSVVWLHVKRKLKEEAMQ